MEKTAEALEDVYNDAYHADMTPEHGSVRRSDSIKSEYDFDDDPLLCGYGSCTPGWLQKFHTAKLLLLFLSTAAFVQSFVVNGIFPSVISTLERQFHLTSTHMGLITSWYDFAVLLVVFPVCHYGNTGHKGRWIGLGSFLMGFGSLLCLLPHYLVDPQDFSDEDPNNKADFGQCLDRNLTDISSVCDNPMLGMSFVTKVWYFVTHSSYLNPYFLLFLLGQTLHGFGATPLFSIGTTYIDENVSQKASPVYLAINSLFQSIGPLFGMLIGANLLQFYVDFDRVDHVPLKGPVDPRWLGAWWIGFLVSGIAAIVIAFPTLMFARELPEAKKHRLKDVCQVHAVSQRLETNGKCQQESVSVFQNVLNLLRNPTFVTCIIIGIFESIIINGFSGFMPKILETLLSSTPAMGGYLASTVILAAAVGVMLGGFLIRKLCLQVGGMLKLVACCHIVSLLFITSFLIQCPARDFIGVNVGYDNHKLRNDKQLIDHCNTDCDCSAKWTPVCHVETGHIYANPCFAGCTKRTKKGEDDYWLDCSCIQSGFNGSNMKLHTQNISEPVDTVIFGSCAKDCGWHMYAFLAGLFLSTTASFAQGIPIQQIMLRVVPFSQRTFAIGVNWTFLRLLGFIPGGILFGKIIDTTCIKWEEKCGVKQSCNVYDNARMAWTIMAIAIVCKLVCILAALIGYMTYRPTDLDSGMSINTSDSRGPLSLTVNDDRYRAEISSQHKHSKNGALKN